MTNRERELYLEYMRQHPWARSEFAMDLARALAFAESCEERKMDWTKCMTCGKGVLLPLSDYGPEGAAVLFKAWVCTNKGCGFTIRIDKGQVAYEINQGVIKKNG